MISWLYRTMGRLEVNVDQLLEGQRQIIAELRQLRKDTNARPKLYKRWWLICLASGVAGALITLLIVAGVPRLLA